MVSKNTTIFILVLFIGTMLQSCKKQEEKNAYLMVYFLDETHSLHMAISFDGYEFSDINKGQPIMAGDTIAEQKGIRDPHISRGPDGTFYLAMTDLHIFANKYGYRDTEWQRDGKSYGWGNNRALVLGKQSSTRFDEIKRLD